MTTETGGAGGGTTGLQVQDQLLLAGGTAITGITAEKGASGEYTIRPIGDEDGNPSNLSVRAGLLTIDGHSIPGLQAVEMMGGGGGTRFALSPYQGARFEATTPEVLRWAPVIKALALDQPSRGPAFQASEEEVLHWAPVLRALTLGAYPGAGAGAGTGTGTGTG
jgi:hypothetical protein